MPHPDSLRAVWAPCLAVVLILTGLTPAAADDRTTGFLLGAHVDAGDATSAADAVAGWEERLDRRLDLVRWYSRWDDPQPAAAVSTAVDRGQTPMLSVWPMRRDGTRVSWATVASGAEDEQIRTQAAGVAGLGVPLYLTFHHEPDIAQGWGTPAEFRAAWRHYVEVFEAAGVSNVRWTWLMTPGSFGSAQSTAGAEAYYPGDDVVDRVGLDAYNWFGCAPNKPPNWRSLATVVGPFRTWAHQRGKVPVLAEFGSAPDPADPQRRATWLREAVDWLVAWPELEAASLFEGIGTCDWRIASDPESLTAFAAAVGRAEVRAVPSAWARLSTGIGPAPLTVRLDMSRSAGSSADGLVGWQVDWGDGSAEASGTDPPGVLSHRYPAGEWTVTVRVTDAAGQVAIDRRRVVASAPVTLTGNESVNGTTATLQAWADPHGLSGTLTLSWGPEGGDAQGRVQFALAPTHYAQAFRHQITGLASGTRYLWTVTATSQAGTQTLSRTFDTPGAPVVRALPATGVGRTAATVPLRVHPHGLDTQVWVEWGPGFGYRSPAQTFAAASWERAGTQQLVGLAPGTAYTLRVVAVNALGTARGPVQAFSTLP